MKLLLLMLSLSLAAFANIGTILAMHGNAQIHRANSSLTARNGMDIQKGDEIVTQDKTKVQIMLDDNTVITIGPKSSFSFNDYFYDGSKRSKLSMRATRGFFRSVTGKIGKIAPERFKVRTNMATIGVRGTDFSAQLTADNAFYRCNRGEISVTFADRVKYVSAGEMLQLQMNGKKVKEKSMSKQGIDAQTQVLSDFDTIKVQDISEKKADIQDVKYDCQQH
ncbi:FecR family protein [Sulfurovum sp.]|uniref:FecR family protein n=1 Tax=Sulfurovum sp. TaxID=1969726 RepID=UPI0025ECF6C5|nr:FecR family protein [Sulfurovum sp.]